MPLALSTPPPGVIFKGSILSSPQSETTRRMLRLVGIVIEVEEDIEEEEG